ncbi:hypothetical protein AOLI_G00238790 [Acnodon oligacanthus]
MCNEFFPIIKPGGRVVNISSMMGFTTLGRCSPDLQASFRSDNITKEDLVGLMECFVKDAQDSAHSQRSWPNTAYEVSKIGLIILTRIQARRLMAERPGDAILCNITCPDWVRTDMAGSKTQKSIGEGAVTPVCLALLPPGAKEPHGQLVSEKKVQPW